MTLLIGVAAAPSTLSPTSPDASRIEYEAVANAAIARWRSGDAADAARILNECPELRKFRTVAIDLAYEEYCLKTAAGDQLDTNSFCDRFPDIRRSLEQQIELHKLIEGSPDLLEKCVESYWPREHDVFLGFEIIEEIGRGAFAHVYRALEIELGNRPVVVKVSTVYGADEASTLGRLEHPNIVSLHSIRHDANRRLSAICMPDLGEVTLDDVLKNRQQQNKNGLEELLANGAKSKLNDRTFVRWYLRRVIEIVAGVLSGLEYAHARGILHLDIKPSNVLLTRDGVPKLLDFNLAHDEQRALSRTGGTIPYMSPEQLSNMQGNCNARLGAHSDVFSVGVLLYEMVTGRLPFELNREDLAVDSGVRVLVEQQRRGVSFTPSEQQELGPDLIQILHDTLRYSLDHRITTASELRSRLLQVLRTEGGVGRRRLLKASVALATGGVFAAIGASAFVTWTRSEELLDRQTDRKVQSGEFRSAINDLVIAVSNRPSFKNLALLGYCCTKIREHRDACHWHGLAISTDSRYAAVWNNLGYSHFKLGHIEEARRALRQATNISPLLQAAHHNLAMLEYFSSMEAHFVPVDAVKGIGDAIRLGEASTELYRDAAVIYARAASYDDRYRNDACKYFQMAVNLGASCDSLAQHQSIRVLVEQNPHLQGLTANSRQLTTRARLIVAPPHLFTI